MRAIQSMLRSAILLVASVLFFAPTALAQPYQSSFISQNVPATMIAGQQYSVTVTMLNTGTDTWTQAGAYRLGSQNGQDNWTWGLHRVDVPTSVGPNQQVTFSFLVMAPATPGTYNFQWRMVQDGVTWFGAFTTNLAVQVQTGGAPYQASFISQNVPATMIAGQQYGVTVTMLNTGTDTWTLAGAYRLGAVNPYDNQTWGLGRVDVPTSVGPNQQVTFSFLVTAPATPGTYNFQWRMVQDGVTWFGAFTTNLAVLVQGAPPQASFISQNVPATMIAGQQYGVTVTMLNSGTDTWTQAGAYRLGSQNPHDGWTWGFNRVDVPTSVGPNQQVTFSFLVTAPATPGTYNFQWRMVQEFVTWFGDFTPTVNVNVCGPPTVALTSPPNGQSVTFPGSFTLSATTNTPALTCPTISKVEFYKNGTLITPVTAAPYTYQWTNVAVGDYVLTAKVYDSSGATATSAPPVTVHVTPGGNPPTVTLAAPSPGQVVAPGATVTVTANPIADTANGRSVANVVLAAKNSSGTVVWSATTYPCTSACGGPGYTATWTTSAAGVFTLTATVTDSVGATGVSPPITLTVDVPPTVSVTSDRSSYPTPATVYLTATATPTVSTIQSVTFYANGVSIGSGTPGAGSTYTFTWLTNVVGTYSVTARATDNFNVTTTSSAITITIVQGGPSTVYYHNDFAGSPLAATDQSGNVLWSESYAPYGERYFKQDTTSNGVWFAGKPTEDSSGLSYFGGRWYNPVVGRFYSADPQRFRDDIPLSFNRYAYANNNPYRFADLNGHSPIDIGFLVWDLGKLGVALYNGSGGGEAAIDVGISAIAVIIPIPGSGLAIKSARAAKAFAEGAKAAEVATEIRLSRSLHAEAAEHAADAIRAGKPDILTIDRAGAQGNRAQAIGGLDKVPGQHLDEYPAAMFKEGGTGASVRPISPRDNMSAGACIGNACRGLPDGARVRITVGE